METWESGLIQRLAKASYPARGTVSSNLTVSAILGRRSLKFSADVAQLDRVLDYESSGRRFDSCRLHHFKIQF